MVHLDGVVGFGRMHAIENHADPRTWSRWSGSSTRLVSARIARGAEARIASDPLRCRAAWILSSWANRDAITDQLFAVVVLVPKPASFAAFTCAR